MSAESEIAGGVLASAPLFHSRRRHRTMRPEDITELTDRVGKACGETLAADGFVVEESAHYEFANDAAQLAAFIGFSGELVQGSLTVIAPLELWRRSYPLALEMTQGWQEEVYDWSRELVNRLLGSIKMALRARGIRLHVSTPKSMLADRVTVLQSARESVCCFLFRCSGMYMSICFDASAIHEATIFAEPDGSEADADPEVAEMLAL